MAGIFLSVQLAPERAATDVEPLRRGGLVHMLLLQYERDDLPFNVVERAAEIERCRRFGRERDGMPENGVYVGRLDDRTFRRERELPHGLHELRIVERPAVRLQRLTRRLRKSERRQGVFPAVIVKQRRGKPAGGLSTLEEKSLGCIHKGGTRPIVEVIAEGARPTKRGAIIMDSPGYDIASVTAMVAGGCQLVVFTTGRGTPTGHALAPVIKITGNRETFQNMIDNMDVDVSSVIAGEKTIEENAQTLFDEVLAVANGKITKAESYGFSDIAIDRICRFI